MTGNSVTVEYEDGSRAVWVNISDGQANLAYARLADFLGEADSVG